MADAAVCAVCGVNDGVKFCGRCKTVAYCGRQHQTQHWKTHKPNCHPQELGKMPPIAQKVKLPADEGSQVQATGVKITETKRAGPLPPESKNVKFDPRPVTLVSFPQLDSQLRQVRSKHVAKQLLKSGFCVIDNVMSENDCSAVLEEVRGLEQKGCLTPGQLAGSRTNGDENRKLVNTNIRSDKVKWLQGQEPEYPAIGKLLSYMDELVMGMNTHLTSETYLYKRTKAMVACYPGAGSSYMWHIDNPSKDGRRVTCIFYLNRNWDVQKNGGILRIFPKDPKGSDSYIDVAPVMNRMLFFWSDDRMPHEVQPAFATRYAVTTWYFDEVERKKAKRENSAEDKGPV